MASKTFLLLGLSFAVVVLIASEVAAKDLAQAATTSSTVSVDKSKGGEVDDINAVLKDAKYDQGYGRYPGGGYEGYPGGGYRGNPRGGYEGYPGDGYRCYYGFCGYGCCNAAEAQAYQAQAQPQN